MAAYVATHDRSVLAKACEDTKVSVTQNTTHMDILGKFICLKSVNALGQQTNLNSLGYYFLFSAIGNDLYQRTVDELETERQRNVTEVEQRAWRLASEEKARALKEAREAAEVELEKAMAAAKKAQVGD